MYSIGIKSYHIFAGIHCDGKEITINGKTTVCETLLG